MKLFSELREGDSESGGSGCFRVTRKRVTRDRSKHDDMKLSKGRGGGRSTGCLTCPWARDVQG